MKGFYVLLLGRETFLGYLWCLAFPPTCYIPTAPLLTILATLQIICLHSQIIEWRLLV